MAVSRPGARGRIVVHDWPPGPSRRPSMAAPGKECEAAHYTQKAPPGKAIASGGFTLVRVAWAARSQARSAGESSRRSETVRVASHRPVPDATPSEGQPPSDPLTPAAALDQAIR